MVTAKRICAVFVFCVCVLGLSSFAHADEHIDYVGISPLWTHISSIRASLSINNGRAVMSGRVTGHTGTTHIITDVVLYRVNSDGTSTPVFTFRDIRAEGAIWLWEAVRFIPRGHDYQVTVYATVFRHGTSQSGAVSSGVVHAH